MSRKSDFIDYVEKRIDWSEASDDVKNYWEILKDKKEKDKPLLSDNGKLILKFMQKEMPEGKAKDIGEGLFISSRVVAGAMRKLVTDEFVEKVGSDPVIYAITEKGRNIIIED